MSSAWIRERLLLIGAVALVAAPAIAACYNNKTTGGCYCLHEWPCDDDPKNDFCCPVVIESDVCIIVISAEPGKAGIINLPACECVYKQPVVVDGECTLIPTSGTSSKQCSSSEINQGSPGC